MRPSTFFAAAVLCCSIAARADDFSFAINGSAGGFSGTGTFSGPEVSGMPGTYNITSVNGTNTNGMIGVNGFNGNDNLLTPNAVTFVNTSGIAFYDQTASGVYQVRLYKSDNPGGGCTPDDSSIYCVDVEEINTTNSSGTSTLPISTTSSSGNTNSTARFAVRFSLARIAAAPTVAATPEPGSLILLGSGTLALAGIARRRASRS